ncbi:arylsulfotransferase (asst) [Halorussus sp. AFM4]|uniref:arylsulfotransferase (asst) n=1 Tax=Halorussus sp. AFM4 TaxID=3421651 RepID=UPI003EBC7DDD
MLAFAASAAVVASVLWTGVVPSPGGFANPLGISADAPDEADGTEWAGLPARSPPASSGLPAGPITVLTTSEREEGGDRANFLAAVRANGSRLYYNDSLRVYNDVDPVPGTNATVLYVGANRLSPSECDAETACWLNVVEEVNLTTGGVRRLYAQKTSVRHGQWHDVDRVGEGRLLVADIARDKAFVVNTTTGIHEWTWSAREDLPLSSGGPFPRDWTHVNDVELLGDGRVMVSLRNQDRVAFVHRQRGLQENWTLGAEDEYGILHEQHNPDFIPAERGGPAVVVADSENDRVVEYRRTDEGAWREAWSWSDDRLDWPRDADRLPNGHTLVTDTKGGRVLEIADNGTVVWRVEVEGAYDAERLGTGDESAGGPAAGSGGPATTAGGPVANGSAESRLSAVAA